MLARASAHSPSTCGLLQIIHDQRADRHFRADIKKDAGGAEGEAGLPQQAEGREDIGGLRVVSP